MTESTNTENIQVHAAESYLEAKRSYAQATINYDYEKTYNYILPRVKAKNTTKDKDEK